MNKSRGATVVQAAGLLMASTILSRVLGYVRDIIISSAYGQGQMTDAYSDCRRYACRILPG